MLRPHTPPLKSESGQAMVEFTIILPIFLMLVLGIAQLGIAFNHYVTLTDAARAGARKAAVSRTASNPTQVTKDAVIASASGLSPALTYSQITVTTSPSWSAGSTVTVCASYPYSINLIAKVVSAGNLNACTTERIE